MTVLNRFALPLCALLIAFMAYISIGQLTTDASPAAAFCTVAERQGVACTVGDKYDAQITTTDDGVGTQHAYLVISQGSKVLTIITLQ